MKGHDVVKHDQLRYGSVSLMLTRNSEGKPRTGYKFGIVFGRLCGLSGSRVCVSDFAPMANLESRCIDSIQRGQL